MRGIHCCCENVWVVGGSEARDGVPAFGRIEPLLERFEASSVVVALDNVVKHSRILVPKVRVREWRVEVGVGIG